MDAVYVYHCDLWIPYACIILICNVKYQILLICDCYNYIYVSLWSANVIWMYHLIYECHITCVFCIPLTYVLLAHKYLFIVIAIVIVWLNVALITHPGKKLMKLKSKHNNFHLKKMKSYSIMYKWPSSVYQYWFVILQHFTLPWGVQLYPVRFQSPLGPQIPYLFFQFEIDFE